MIILLKQVELKLKMAMWNLPNFCYLGAFMSFNLKDDYVISESINKAIQSMGANKHLCNFPHTDMFSNCQFFLALVVNKLL